jgi:large subunit ribosomal protein L20
MNGLLLANVGLNRKQLSELAISHPEVFSEIVEIAKKARSAASAA